MNHTSYHAEALVDAITISAIDRLFPKTLLDNEEDNDGETSSNDNPYTEISVECHNCHKGGRLKTSTRTNDPLSSHSDHTSNSSQRQASNMMSIMPMIDDSYTNSTGGEDWSSDLDDSASTVKVSNLNRKWRRRSHQHDYARRRAMTEVASRWESFPSSRSRLAPPRRPVTPPPPSSNSSTCSSLGSSQSGSNSSNCSTVKSSAAAPPPPAMSLRQQSQGCLAPRVPKRKSSLEAIKRDQQEDEDDPPICILAQPLLRRISDDSAATTTKANPQHNPNSNSKHASSSTAATHTTLRLPTRQPSFQT